MFRYNKLTSYLVKLLITQFLILCAIIIIILFITSSFDIIHRFRGSDLISTQDFFYLICYRIPHLFNELSLIIAFIVSLMFLHNLSKTNELLIILASGVHLWRVFSIMMMFTFCLGLFFVGIVNPLASFALQKYDKLSAKLSNRYSATMFVTKSKIFFREYTEQENYFIAASSVDIGRNKIYNVSLIVTNAQYKFLYRAEAQEASINNNNLILHNPVISSTDKIQTLPELSFPTKISLYQLTLSLKSPEKISIWQLPNMIDYSSQSGLPVTKYQLHYYKELAKPFAMVAMSQIPYLFLNLSTRRNKTSHIMHAVVLNIITYGVLEFVFRVLAYNGLSPAWSVMLPLAFIILIINFAILHLQEA